MSRHVATVLAALLLVAAPAAADSTCPVNDPNHIADLVLPSELEEIVGSSAAREAVDVWRDTSQRIDRLRQRARRESTGAPGLSELAALLDDVLAGYDGTDRTARELRRADLQVETCEGDPLAETESCAWETLRGAVRPTRDDEAPWSCEAKTRFATYLVAAQRLVDRIVAPSVQEAAEDLAGFVSQWRRYVETGFSQYPHEVWLNGRMLDEGAWGPPPNQLILIHPAVGFGTSNLTEVGGGRRTGALALAVEAVGYVRYWSDFRHHVGISAAAVLPNFEGKQTGLGAVLHFDGVGLGYGIAPHGDHAQTVYVLYDVTRGIDDSRLGRHAKGWVQEQLR